MCHNIPNMLRATPLLCLILLLTNPAFAGQQSEDKELAKKHFKAGLLLLEVENYEVAAGEFQSSVDLYPTKAGFFNLASCFVELKRYGEAREAIDKLKAQFFQELNPKFQSEITAFELSLDEKTIEVTVQIDKDGATVHTDGREVGKSPLKAPLLLDEGEHVIEVTLEGHEKAEHKVVLVAGEVEPKNVSINLKPAGGFDQPQGEEPKNVRFSRNNKEKSKGRKRVWTWVVYGLAGAAGISAIATGALNLSWTSQIEDKCGGKNCSSQLHLKDDVETVKRLGTATNVLIGVSSVGLILGTILFFAEGRDKDEGDDLAIIPMVSPRAYGVSLSKTF